MSNLNLLKLFFLSKKNTPRVGWVLPPSKTKATCELFQLQFFRVFGTIFVDGMDRYHLAVVLISINYLSLDGRRHESMQSKLQIVELPSLQIRSACVVWGISPHTQKQHTFRVPWQKINPNSQMLCFKRHQKIEMVHLVLRAGSFQASRSFPEAFSNYPHTIPRSHFFGPPTEFFVEVTTFIRTETFAFPVLKQFRWILAGYMVPPWCHVALMCMESVKCQVLFDGFWLRIFGFPFWGLPQDTIENHRLTCGEKIVIDQSKVNVWRLFEWFRYTRVESGRCIYQIPWNLR